MLKYRLTLFSSLLLLSLSTVYAAPPSTPTLNVISQGLSVDAEWSAVGATGYRLFTSIDSDKVEMSDMGSMNRISAVMKHGTMVSVYVQAYNTDGDSPYSEMKTLVLNDPILGKTPDMLKPEAQALTFQSISLDTPVAFLPTDEDVDVQDRTVRNRSGQRTYGPEFDEGRISLTAHIAPTLIQRESLELSLCLGVADTCEPLLVWNSDKQSYVETVTIRDLPNDVEKNVYLELLLPKALVEKLRAQSTEEQEYVIYATDVKSTNPAAQLVHIAKIPVINLGGRDTRRATRSWLKIVTPQLSKEFKSDKFGVAFTVTPQLWIYKTKADPTVKPAIEAKAGGQLGATGTVTATVIGNKFDVMNLVGTATKNSGKRLTRKVTVNILGKDVYVNWQSKKPKALTAPEKPKVPDVPDETNWQVCTVNGKVDPLAKCSETPPTDDGDAGGGDESDEASPSDNIFSYTKTVEKSYSQTYVLAIIPITATLGMKGEVSLNVGLGVEITTGPVGLKLTGAGGVGANLGGSASASVTILVASAGVEGTVTLINNQLAVQPVANLVFSPSKLSFNGSVTDTVTGPNGTVSLFATYKVPAWSLPPWTEKKVSKTLVSWTTFNKTYTLVSWGKNGEDVPQDPNGVMGNDLTKVVTSGDALVTFTTAEPTGTDKSWVCAYATVPHGAPKMDASGVPAICNAPSGAALKDYYINDTVQVTSCTQLPDGSNEIEIGIDSLSRQQINHRSKCPTGAGTAYDDSWYTEKWNAFTASNVTALKIGGPLRLGLFESLGQTGSSAYWYAYSGVIEPINLNKIPANYMLGKAGSLLMTRIDVQDKIRSNSAASALSACFYQNANATGDHFCLPKGDGTKPLTAADNKNPKMSDPKAKIEYVGDFWNHKIGSVSITGFGLVCAYTAKDFAGKQNCYTGHGNAYTINFVGDDYQVSALWLVPSFVHVLSTDLTTTLKDAQTSSLPNSAKTIAAFGALAGIDMGSSSNDIMYSTNTASTISVKGPVTVALYAQADRKGKRSMFFLDDGEWDFAYLSGINDDVETWISQENTNCNAATSTCSAGW
jgi:hypothetical protein